MLKQKIGFIGGGEMARALAHGLVTQGQIRGNLVHVSDPHDAAIERFRAAVPGSQRRATNLELARQCRLLVLAVKPSFAAEACREIAGAVRGSLLLSVVAGLRIEHLAELVQSQRIVRVMPNTPCLVGVGATGIAAGPRATARDVRLAERLFSAVGVAVTVPEEQLDAVTGLSGSGPAYVFNFVQALADGGVLMGLPRATAQRLAIQTVLGAATLLRSTGEHPAALSDKVASAGGTTIHGLEALEQAGFRGGVLAAVRAATERSRALSHPPAV